MCRCLPEGVAHGPATLFLHTGTTNFIRPSMGAWINYGLGTENENLPGFVSISPSLSNDLPRKWQTPSIAKRWRFIGGLAAKVGC
jgi:hypothetical protein